MKGKTLAAGILGRKPMVGSYQVKLPVVAPKYIGETEKNLSVVVRKPGETFPVQNLDEADSLLSKRTEVKDAHDRFANMDVD